MSEMNESQGSFAAGGGADAAYGAGAMAGDADSLNGFEHHKNPFKDPGDDEIFTFKDKERTRKEQERI